MELEDESGRNEGPRGEEGSLWHFRMGNGSHAVLT